ncbi:hypothetical protein VTL71DRAFT_15436 [Oculimacula yallundae]|uniref:Uncharacterized protein n=1 Tax=Oculimacula yallundae TaxID=86028 RepID=A0ABR4CIR3_9HELO
MGHKATRRRYHSRKPIAKENVSYRIIITAQCSQRKSHHPLYPAVKEDRKDLRTRCSKAEGTKATCPSTICEIRKVRWKTLLQVVLLGSVVGATSDGVDY